MSNTSKTGVKYKYISGNFKILCRHFVINFQRLVFCYPSDQKVLLIVWHLKFRQMRLICILYQVLLTRVMLEYTCIYSINFPTKIL